MQPGNERQSSVQTPANTLTEATVLLTENMENLDSTVALRKVYEWIVPKLIVATFGQYGSAAEGLRMDRSQAHCRNIPSCWSSSGGSPPLV